jgi:hypothetical protein
MSLCACDGCVYEGMVAWGCGVGSGILGRCGVVCVCVLCVRGGCVCLCVYI